MSKTIKNGPIINPSPSKKVLKKKKIIMMLKLINLMLYLPHY